MFQQQEQSAVCIEYDSDEMGELYRTRAEKKKYKLLLNSDEERFGGWGNEIPAEIMAEKSLTITRIILSALICPLTELLYFCSKCG